VDVFSRDAVPFHDFGNFGSDHERDNKSGNSVQDHAVRLRINKIKVPVLVIHAVSTLVPLKIYIVCNISILMEKKYTYPIIGAVLIIAVVASAYALHRSVESFRSEFEESLEERFAQFSEKVQEQPPQNRGNIRNVFEFNLMSKEEAEDIKEIAQSDEMVNAILEVLGEHDVEVLQTPMRNIAILRYSSEDHWRVQVTIDTELKRAESITINRGIVPLVFDPQKFMQIAEERIPLHELEHPVLKKITQSDNGAEIVFLTDEGLVTVKVNSEEEVISLVRESAGPFMLLPLFILGISIMAILGIIILLVIISRSKKGKEPTEDTEESENEKEQGDNETE
jgi:hypothetical protein